MTLQSALLFGYCSKFETGLLRGKQKVFSDLKVKGGPFIQTRF